MKQLRAILATALATLSLGASPPNWNSTVVETPEGGHLVGNPEAEVKLVEYVSYTCSHCAHFEIEADAPLRLTFIAPGKGSIEYRPLLRNRIDVAVALLVGCGPPSKFRGNHARFLRRQDRWLGDFSAAQQQRWNVPDFGAGMRAMASDLKLYEIMGGRGYTRVQLDRCLSDREAGSRLARQSSHAVENLGVNATPSFLINGKLQDVHDWSSLRPRLAELVR